MIELFKKRVLEQNQLTVKELKKPETTEKLKSIIDKRYFDHFKGPNGDLLLDIHKDLQDKTYHWIENAHIFKGALQARQSKDSAHKENQGYKPLQEFLKSSETADSLYTQKELQKKQEKEALQQSIQDIFERASKQKVSTNTILVKNLNKKEDKARTLSETQADLLECAKTIRDLPSIIRRRKP